MGVHYMSLIAVLNLTARLSRVGVQISCFIVREVAGYIGSLFRPHRITS